MLNTAPKHPTTSSATLPAADDVSDVLRAAAHTRLAAQHAILAKQVRLVASVLERRPRTAASAQSLTAELRRGIAFAQETWHLLDGRTVDVDTTRARRMVATAYISMLAQLNEIERQTAGTPGGAGTAPAGRALLTQLSTAEEARVWLESRERRRVGKQAQVNSETLAASSIRANAEGTKRRGAVTA